MKIINNFDEIKKDIDKITEIIDGVIKNIDYETIALNIYERNDIFFIGRLVDYALALEGSLKLKEISYINSVAYAAGELKHGTISLIDKGTPVISLATNQDLYDKTISNIKETKARGAYNILISNINNKEFDELILIPQVDEMLTPLVTVIPLQLLAYEIAKLNNCDIDKPRNLAKSVTVE